jgi:hypothetical protein
MTLTAPPASRQHTQPQQSSQPSPSTPSSNSRHAVLAGCVASPLLAVLLALGLLTLAAGGAFIATHTMSGQVHWPFHQTANPYGRTSRSPATFPNESVNDPDLAGLFVRGQPMRWTPAQTRAVAEKNAGKNYIRNDYKAAMKAAQYNEKNGWTANGAGRTNQGTPLRNNQKRESNSGKPQQSGSCLQSFTLTAPVCGEGSEDFGGGDGESPFGPGGIEFEEP